jgi:lipocalin
MQPNLESLLAIARLRFWGRKNIVRMVCLAVLSVLALSFNLAGGVIYTAVILVIYMLLWFSLPIITRNKMNKNKDLLNITTDYTFNDDKSVNIITKRNNDKLTEFNLKNTDILKIKDTKKIILLYVSKRQTFYIDKKILTDEQISEIKKML